MNLLIKYNGALTLTFDVNQVRRKVLGVDPLHYNDRVFYSDYYYYTASLQQNDDVNSLFSYIEENDEVSYKFIKFETTKGVITVHQFYSRNLEALNNFTSTELNDWFQNRPELKRLDDEDTTYQAISRPIGCKIYGFFQPDGIERNI